jgi:hypothetical protein
VFADVTYWYYGQPMTDAALGLSSCLNACPVTGSITLASALPDNFAFNPITPLSFSFSNGIATIDETNATAFFLFPAFFISTNAEGDTEQWSIALTTSSVSVTQTALFTGDYTAPVGFCGGCTTDAIYQYDPDLSGFASNSNDPGFWSVPETSTWAMMLVGFAGLGLAGYRTSRKAVSIA